MRAPVTGEGGGKKSKVSEKSRFIWAEGQQESGGNYHAVNAGSGALGRWQVMPANLPSWLARSGQRDMSPQAYLDDAKAQDKLAWTILGGDYDKWGPRGAASVWYSGQSDWHATYGDPPVYQYVADVIRIMGGAPALGAGAGALGGSGSEGAQTVSVGNPPRPGKESWSAQIKTHATAFHNNGTAITRHRTAIAKLKIEL